MPDELLPEKLDVWHCQGNWDLLETDVQTCPAENLFPKFQDIYRKTLKQNNVDTTNRIRGDTQMTSTFTGWEEGGGGAKNEIISDVRGRGVASVLDVQSLFFLLKKIGFAPWTDIMLSQTLIYHWPEIFLLTLVSDSEAIL